MTIRITWARAAAALAGLIAAGLLFAWSGIFNIAASSGHWPITDWFLHWTMRNSVRTHAAFAAPADPAARQPLVSAAGHFAASCAACHGAPGRRPSPVMQGATPPAPDLAVNAREWTDRQIFWILQHGVKYTGMPAWAVPDRPDEVRRMTAFVRRLPGMTPAEYRALTEDVAPAGVAGAPSGAGVAGAPSGLGVAGAPSGAGVAGAPSGVVAGIRDGVLDGCTGCHGTDGRGRGQPDIPVLGGQRPAYLLASLRAYAAGTRHSAVMGNAAAALRPDEMQALARHFAALPGIGTGAPAGPATARAIVERGLPDRQLPACASCHTPGKPYPILAGQRAAYIAQRLRQWRGEKEVVDARKSQATMPVIARRIPEEMIDPLARYLAGTAR